MKAKGKRLPRYIAAKRIGAVQVSRSSRGVHVSVDGEVHSLKGGRWEVKPTYSVTAMPPTQARQLARLILKMADSKVLPDGGLDLKAVFGKVKGRTGGR